MTLVVGPRRRITVRTGTDGSLNFAAVRPIVPVVLLMIAVAAVLTVGVLAVLNAPAPGRHRASAVADPGDEHDLVVARPSPRPWWCG